MRQWDPSCAALKRTELNPRRVEILRAVGDLDMAWASSQVNSLKKAGYVTGDLAFGQTKYMGVCRHKSWGSFKIPLYC